MKSVLRYKSFESQKKMLETISFAINENHSCERDLNFDDCFANTHESLLQKQLESL